MLLVGCPSPHLHPPFSAPQGVADAQARTVAGCLPLPLPLQIPFDMRDIAGHMLTILTSLESEAFAISKAHDMGKATDEDLELSNVLLEVVQVRRHTMRRAC